MLFLLKNKKALKFNSLGIVKDVKKHFKNFEIKVDISRIPIQ